MQDNTSAQSIQQLPKDTVRQLNSGQVITRVDNVVKELLENSLDAGATSIEVKLIGHGLSSLSVKDNGSGIASEDRNSMARRYYTSKISSFGDLVRVTTYGFRGEALASICAVSDSVELITQHGTEPVATLYNFDKDGTIIESKTGGTMAKTGTHVTAHKLFRPFIVRRQQALKTTAQSTHRIQDLLHTYALAHPHVRFSLKCVSSPSETSSSKKKSAPINNNAQQEWSKPSTKDMLESVRVMFGTDVAAAVKRVEVSGVAERESDNDSEEETKESKEDEWCVEGVLPKIGADPMIIYKPDRVFLFINSRPVTHSKAEMKSVVAMIRSRVADTFEDREAMLKKTPFIALNFRVPRNSYDVNVEPSKNYVIFNQSERIFELVEHLLDMNYPVLSKPDKNKESTKGNKELTIRTPSPSPLECIISQITPSNTGSVNTPTEGSCGPPPSLITPSSDIASYSQPLKANDSIVVSNAKWNDDDIDQWTFSMYEELFPDGEDGKRRQRQPAEKQPPDSFDLLEWARGGKGVKRSLYSEEMIDPDLSGEAAKRIRSEPRSPTERMNEQSNEMVGLVEASDDMPLYDRRQGIRKRQLDDDDDDDDAYFCTFPSSNGSDSGGRSRRHSVGTPENCINGFELMLNASQNTPSRRRTRSCDPFYEDWSRVTQRSPDVTEGLDKPYTPRKEFAYPPRGRSSFPALYRQHQLLRSPSPNQQKISDVFSQQRCPPGSSSHTLSDTEAPAHRRPPTKRRVMDSEILHLVQDINVPSLSELKNRSILVRQEKIHLEIAETSILPNDALEMGSSVNDSIKVLAKIDGELYIVAPQAVESSEIYIVDLRRVKELVVFEELLENYDLAPRNKLDRPIEMNICGDDPIFSVLHCLEGKQEEVADDGHGCQFTSFKIITDKIILANGFSCRWRVVDDRSIVLQITALTPLIRLYGPPDLRSLLLHLSEKLLNTLGNIDLEGPFLTKNDSTLLANSRPQKVVEFFMAEAQRRIGDKSGKERSLRTLAEAEVLVQRVASRAVKDTVSWKGIDIGDGCKGRVWAGLHGKAVLVMVDVIST